MNNDIFFWKKWDGAFKSIYQFLFFVTATLLGAYLVILFFGDDIAFDWLITTRLESKPINIGINNSFGVPATFSTNLSVLQQYFEGSNLKISATPSYTYLAFFGLGIIICLTISTYLKRFLFMVSTALFIFLLFVLNLSTLKLFGLEGNMVAILVFLLYTPLAYYFHDIKTGVPLKNRLSAFTGITIALAIVIHFFSTVESPFLNLAASIFIPAVIISVVFIFLIGYEIVYTILIITTQSIQESKTNNTKHFIILTLIYLINLVFAYLRNTGKIDWDIYYINAFVLFAISAVLGIWGLKDRENLYESTLPFYPYTGVLYLGLLIISLSTIGFHTFQSNDPVLEAFEDAIIFGHIGFGSMFFLYIIANFISLLVKNLPVYKIAFKEDNFPYVTSRIAGLIVVAMFFFFSNKASMNQAIAGYFIGYGDYYYLQNNNSAAVNSYRIASRYAPNNHRSNYTLSGLTIDKKEAVKFTENSTKKNPSPYAFINNGLNFLNNGKFFDALFTYQDGIVDFPSSDELKNNLAVLYSGTEVLDSAVYYLNEISDKKIKRGTGLTNQFALSVLKDVDFNQAFSYDRTLVTERLDVNANMLAKLVSQPDTVLRPSFLVTDNRLNLMSYAYINNLGIWSFSNPNNSYLQIVESLLNNPSNDEYKEQLLLFKALNLYNNGSIIQAYKNISELIGVYGAEGTYAFIAALWSLEQNAPKLAFDFMEQSVEQGSQDAKLFLPLVLWLNDESNRANTLLSELTNEDSLDSRVSIVSRIIQTNKSEMRQKIDQYFKNRVSLTAGNVLDDITVSESENDIRRTAELYRLIGSLNPFFTEGVLAAVNYFNEVKEEDKAYDIIVSNMEINPYSEGLVKAYIDQCFSMGFDNYAETGLLKLLDILSKEEYDKYEIVFDLKKEQLEQQDLDW